MVGGPGKITEIRRLDPNASWYSESDSGVTIVENLKKGQKTGPLSESVRLAVALTHACCKQGNGMVYSMTREPRPLSRTDFSQDELQACVVRTSLPNLVYVPERWTEERVAEWNAWSVEEKLERCWGPCGWVRDEVPVLPISLVTSSEALEERHWSKLHTSMRSPVLAVVRPVLHLGLKEEIVSSCHFEEGCVIDHRRPRSLRSKTTSVDVTDWKVADMKTAASWLFSTYAQKQEALQLFGQVMDAITTASHTLNLVDARILESEKLRRQEVAASANTRNLLHQADRERNLSALLNQPQRRSKTGDVGEGQSKEGDISEVYQGIAEFSSLSKMAKTIAASSIRSGEAKGRVVAVKSLRPIVDTAGAAVVEVASTVVYQALATRVGHKRAIEAQELVKQAAFKAVADVLWMYLLEDPLE